MRPHILHNARRLRKVVIVVGSCATSLFLLLSTTRERVAHADDEPAPAPAAVDTGVVSPQPNTATTRTSIVAAKEPANGNPRQAPPTVNANDPAPEPAERTVIGTSTDHGGYGAPEMKLTSLGHTAGILAGAQGGWIVAHRLVVAGAGYGLVTDVDSPSVLQPVATGERARLSFAYGGIKLGALIASKSVVHPTISLLIGGGSVRSATNTGDASTRDTFFVLEPEAGLEANLARSVRLGTVLTYRFVGGTDQYGFTSTALSGFAGGLALKFGSF